MVTADVLAVVFVLLGLLLAVPAYLLVIGALWPRLAVQSTARFAQTPIRSLVMGVFVGIPLTAPAFALLGSGPGPARGLGLFWLCGALGLAIAGLHGLAVRIGATLPDARDANTPWWPLVKGIVALQLATLVPLVGWFLVLPLSLTAGLGAALLALGLPLATTESVSAGAPVGS